MSNQQWEYAWKNNQIDFHQTEINPLLQDYWATLALPNNAPVFVPLCGKSEDMQWLLLQNYQVIGIEISPIAVAAFFTEHQLTPNKTRHGKLTRWQCNNLTIFCGDFFDLNKHDLIGVLAVYDRAALLALSPVKRKRYVRHMRTILPENCPTLLLTTEYPEIDTIDSLEMIDGEIVNLYQRSYNIQLLHAESSVENFPGHGHDITERTEEKVYLLQSHAKSPPTKHA